MNIQDIANWEALKKLVSKNEFALEVKTHESTGQTAHIIIKGHGTEFLFFDMSQARYFIEGFESGKAAAQRSK